jgi:hypothetical protein
MAEDLNVWISRVTAARTQKDMYAVLEQFKNGDWDDEQRSTIAKLYMRIIAQLPAGDESSAAGEVGA